MNRILKATLRLLLRADVSRERKKKLRKLLLYFGDVSEVRVTAIQWHLRFDRSNQTYRMLMAVCYLVIKGLLQTQTGGTMRVMDFLDEQRMCHTVPKNSSSHFTKKSFRSCTRQPLRWHGTWTTSRMSFCPSCRVTSPSPKGRKSLSSTQNIMPTPCRPSTMSTRLHSGNLYQIFTYVKNRDSSYGDAPHEVSGMLLYARTDEEFPLPSRTYRMSGNKIAVRTLDPELRFCGDPAAITDDRRRIFRLRHKPAPQYGNFSTRRGRCIVLWFLRGNQPLPAQPKSSIFSLHLSTMAAAPGASSLRGSKPLPC